MRVGIYDFDRKHYAVLGAANYIGLQAIHVALGVVLYFFLIFCCLCLCQKENFIYAYQKGIIIIEGIIWIFVAKIFAKFIVGHFITTGLTIYHRRLWTIFDDIWIFVNVVAILALSALRLLAWFIAAVHRFGRMDTSFLGKDEEYLDPGYNSYVSMMLVDHLHTNPVVNALMYKFVADMKEIRSERKKIFLEKSQNKKEAAGGSTPLTVLSIHVAEEDEGAYEKISKKSDAKYLRRLQISFRWWLMVTLHNNPSLRALRKVRV